ncbi:VOC family protein [Yoonia vestfoldensis]|jgi:hypothetical protein|uniref:Glyoxalase-like domain protein n=1 Tax=Yoonia vestfoldensis TaxID=245188 RepID=A0A1Y0ECX2_9RHOB|nr:VOC family protein [Yoonia vestfoldensis]ARU01433.1 glyoxalase-like domain protein [Yoonia vestfoldensis]
MLRLDHLAVVAPDLAMGTAWVEAALGVTLQPGGKHARYGTHNTLLGLGDDLYLEVIAKDPEASPYDGPTWFGLDDFTGAPRLGNWICQTDDLDGLLRDAPAAVGLPRDLSRGDLAWRITVPEDGSKPYDGAYPTLIQWAAGTHHPARRLAESGCRLLELTVSHPQADDLRAMLPLADDRVRFVVGPAGFAADFDTKQGRRRLC